MLTAVGMLFTACNKDQNCGHEFIEYDNTKNLVGTWTYVEGSQAEAIQIKEDGSFTITGVMIHGALYEEKGTIKVVNNKVTLAYNSGDVFEGRLELVAGKSLSIVLNEEYDIRLTYDYCENDLSDEVVGMWVCHEGLPGVENDMAIKTYSENGKYTLTTQASAFIPEDIVGAEADYVIIGDLLFMHIAPQHLVARLTYTPNGTTLGDIMTETLYAPSDNGDVYLTSSWLRVKQNLNTTGKTYDYTSAYVSNAKGIDEDFTIFGNTFNMAKIEAGDFDVFFRSELFCVDLNTNSIKQYYRTANGQDIVVEIPITVDGNKVTLDMSAENSAFRKVEMYMFQDADDSQLHMYMHTDAFINYFANLQLFDLISDGKIDPTDTAAVEKVFSDMDARVESINVSFVFKARK